LTLDEIKSSAIFQKDLSISVFKLSRAMAKKDDAFYKKVIDRHILLHGSGLK
jgi:hypothetical protein